MRRVINLTLLPPYQERRRALMTCVLTALLIALTIFVSAAYVLQEHDFYYFDGGRSHGIANEKVLKFHQSPLAALADIKESLGEAYNEVFTLPLLPFMMLFGDSRLVFVLGVALVYQLPYALAMGAIAARLVPVAHPAVFWSAAFISLITPMVWAPALRGYPDVGGALFLALAILVYLKDMTLRHWWQPILIGIFIVVAILLRRPFVYGAMAFFMAVTAQAFLAQARDRETVKPATLREVWTRTRRIFITGIATLIILVAVGLPFVKSVLAMDFKALNASHIFPIDEVIRFYILSFGWPSWVLAGLGLAVGAYTGTVRRSVSIFLLLFGISTALIWVFSVRYVAVHYNLHFATLIVLGLTGIVWMAYQRLHGAARAVAISAVAIYLLLNAFVALTSTELPHHSFIGPMFAAKHPPSIRSDYDEINRLVVYLRSTVPRKQGIYVAAASTAINGDLLKNAERSVYGRDESFLNLLIVPTVDSRDAYPLEALLDAQYVVNATPWQPQQKMDSKLWLHQLRREQQRVVELASVIFEKHWEIADDFVQLPVQFHLNDGIVLTLYKRTRPTSLPTTLRTLEAMADFLGMVPGGQLDWIIVNNAQEYSAFTHRYEPYSATALRTVKAVSGFLEMIPRGQLAWPLLTDVHKDLTDKHEAYSIFSKAGVESHETDLLYIRKLPDHGMIRGVLNLLNHDGCDGLSLRASVIGETHTVLETQEAVHRPGGPSEFVLSPGMERGAYVLLHIENANRHHDQQSCGFSIDPLTVLSSEAS